MLIFLMGLNWGGGLYSWDGAHVIAVLVAGAVGFMLASNRWKTAS